MLFVYVCSWLIRAFQVALVVKNPPANTGDISSIPGWRIFPGGGNGYPLQYACLENPMDRGAWQAMFHGVAKSQTQLKWLSTHARMADSSCCTAETNTTLLCSYPLIKGKRCYGLQTVVFAIKQGKKQICLLHSWLSDVCAICTGQVFLTWA